MTSFSNLIFVVTCLGAIVDAGETQVLQDASWDSKIIDEGPCFIPPEPKVVAFNFDWLKSALISDWYVTMFSRMYIHGLSLLSTGEVNTTKEYLDNLCLKFTPNTPVTKIVGIRDNTTEVSCQTNDHTVGVQECMARNRTNHADEREVRSVATWTDNKKYIFLTLCLPIGKKAWIMLGNEKPGNMTPEDKTAIANHIVELGFNPDLALNFTYDERCWQLPTTTPSPLPSTPSSKVSV